MANKIKHIFSTIMIIFFICTVSYASETKSYTDGQIVVQFTAETSSQTIDELVKDYGMTIIEQIPQINYYVFQLPATHDVEEAVAILKDLDIVLECEPNYITNVHALPDDDLFSQQWSLHTESSDNHLHMDKAWDIEAGDPDVIVAVIDIGFDVTHEDLQDNIWQNAYEIPDNGFDDDGNGYTDDIIGWDFINKPSIDSVSDMVDEDNDPSANASTHGNRVFGVLGASMNNGIGIAGIAGNCKIMLIRAGYLNENGNPVLSVSSINKGIIYAVDNGAKVINLSAGGTSYSSSFKSAVEYALENGVVVVCSAGNDGTTDPHYPAAFDLAGLISVGASTEDDESCSFSSYGDWVDVAAPGDEILSTLFNDKYGITQGTSFSAPMVAGVAALLVSKFPDWTPAQIQDRIMNTVDVSESLSGANISSGRVNAYRALHTELDGASAELSESSSGSSGSCFISTTAGSSSNNSSMIILVILGIAAICVSQIYNRNLNQVKK